MAATESYAPRLDAAVPGRSPRSRSRCTESRTVASRAATERARRSLPARRPVVVPGLRPAPDRGQRAQAAVAGGRGRQPLRRLQHGLRRAVRRSLPPDRPRAVEDQLDDGTLFVTPCEANAEVAELLAERYGLPHVALHQLGHRGHDGRHPRRSGRHGPGQDREGRGWLPRPPRRGHDLDEAAARRRRSGSTRRVRSRPPRASPLACCGDTSSSRSTTSTRSSGCCRVTTWPASSSSR